MYVCIYICMYSLQNRRLVQHTFCQIPLQSTRFVQSTFCQIYVKHKFSHLSFPPSHDSLSIQFVKYLLTATKLCSRVLITADISLDVQVLSPLASSESRMAISESVPRNNESYAAWFSSLLAPVSFARQSIQGMQMQLATSLYDALEVDYSTIGTGSRHSGHCCDMHTRWLQRGHVQWRIGHLRMCSRMHWEQHIWPQCPQEQVQNQYRQTETPHWQTLETGLSTHIWHTSCACLGWGSNSSSRLRTTLLIDWARTSWGWGSNSSSSRDPHLIWARTLGKFSLRFETTMQHFTSLSNQANQIWHTFWSGLAQELT